MQGKSVAEQNISGADYNFRVFQGIFQGAEKIQGFQGPPGFPGFVGQPCICVD